MDAAMAIAPVMKNNQDTDMLSGTINTILCINKELTHGAMVRSVMMATEAKTAALQELNSCYSNGFATGTGTDQIAVACTLTEKSPLTSAGKHSK